MPDYNYTARTLQTKDPFLLEAFLTVAGKDNWPIPIGIFIKTSKGKYKPHGD